MSRKPVRPLTSGWVIVDGPPVFHRFNLDAGSDAEAMVHVHGFGISGTYLEPTAALLHRTTARSCPICREWDAASGLRQDSTYPGWRRR